MILIADDDLESLKATQLILELEGYSVVTAMNGYQALQALESNPISLIIADIAMPEMNGYQLLQRVRQVSEWVFIPFLFLSARALSSDIRFGKELGADDYLTKPVSPADLRAAVRGKMLRANQWQKSYSASKDSTSNNHGEATETYSVGKIKIDVKKHLVEAAGKQIQLSAREFMLLKQLAKSGGEVVHFEELIDKTHGLRVNAVEAGALIRPMIRSLRRKLGYQAGEKGCIENVRGVGYRILMSN